jgi:hypothetical protein
MTFAALVAVVALGSQQPPAIPDELVISAVVLDKKGHPVTDLKPEEFVVAENGSERAVTRAELDARPLKIALLLDTSSQMGTTYNADVVPAALSFLKRLPQGATFSVWSTSDRPKVIVSEGTDLKTTEDKLRNLAAVGNNAAVDTLVAASQEVSKAEGHRSAVVLVSSATMGDISTDLQSLLPKASLKPTYIAVEVIQGDRDARLEDALSLLATRTGGFHERVFSTMAIEAQLRRALDVVGSLYRIAWKPGMDPRQAKIVVKVKRPNTKLTQALRLSTAW